MATESPIRILGETNKWARHKPSSSYGSLSSAKIDLGDFSLFLTGQSFQNLEKDVLPSRSESAPPSMEGSIASTENVFSQPKSDNGSNVRLNNIISNLRGKHRASFHHSGHTGNDDSSRVHMNVLPSHEEESEDDISSKRSASVDRSLDCQYSLFDSSVEGSSHSSSHSHVLFSDKPDGCDSEANLPMLRDLSVSESLNRTSSSDKTAHVQSFGTVKIDENYDLSSTGVGDFGSGVDVPNGVIPNDEFGVKDSAFRQNFVSCQQVSLQESNIYWIHSSFPQTISSGISQAYGGSNQFQYASSSSVSTAESQQMLQASGFTPQFFSPNASFISPQSSCYPNLHPSVFFTPQYGIGGYPFNSTMLPPYPSGYPHQSSFSMSFDNLSFYEMQNSLKFYGQIGVPIQPNPNDPCQLQFFQCDLLKDSLLNPENVCELKKGQDFTGNSNDPKSQNEAGAGFSNLTMGRGNASNHYSVVSPINVWPIIHFHSPSIINPVVQEKPIGAVNSGGIINTPHPYALQNQSWNYMNSNSFLEELKSGKGQRFEISDISGRIVEFGVDQHGSRFIQQKLEHCSAEEKASVFKEVIPHASKLMTDVFGNYVIQKLFEYGSLEQKRDLAGQLERQMLPLSLQMYGCRVIQKALEVITLEQKVKLAKELDGHVMKCIRDQNGNHVIQKCIESIPTNHIHFIISSFRGNVATLSMHPYGCRVIQRVLEHCKDDAQTKFIVNEILDSVCSLAQDQYGNYVTQHVLEREISCEWSAIIGKLSGSIVQLSQHKFASNVIEKCLEYGDSSARDLLIKEIIGHGAKDDNVLVMMKDRYANYVIQKILQKCTSDEREVLLSLIRNHLTALKKYTYGKHIVARLEQLYGDVIQQSGS